MPVPSALCAVRVPGESGGMQPTSVGPGTEPSTPTGGPGEPDPTDPTDADDADDAVRIVAALHGDGEPDEIAMWTVMERRRRRRERAGVGPAC